MDFVLLFIWTCVGMFCLIFYLLVLGPNLKSKSGLVTKIPTKRSRPIIFDEEMGIMGYWTNFRRINNEGLIAVEVETKDGKLNIPRYECQIVPFNNLQALTSKRAAYKIVHKLNTGGINAEQDINKGSVIKNCESGSMEKIRKTLNEKDEEITRHRRRKVDLENNLQFRIGEIIDHVGRLEAKKTIARNNRSIPGIEEGG